MAIRAPKFVILVVSIRVTGLARHQLVEPSQWKTRVFVVVENNRSEGLTSGVALAALITKRTFVHVLMTTDAFRIEPRVFSRPPTLLVGPEASKLVASLAFYFGVAAPKGKSGEIVIEFAREVPSRNMTTLAILHTKLAAMRILMFVAPSTIMIFESFVSLLDPKTMATHTTNLLMTPGEFKLRVFLVIKTNHVEAILNVARFAAELRKPLLVNVFVAGLTLALGRNRL